jgi:hypothetical protein
VTETLLHRPHVCKPCHDLELFFFLKGRPGAAAGRARWGRVSSPGVPATAR